MAKTATRTRRRSFEEINQEILSALDVRAEYQALGLNVNGHTPNGKGWLSCYAVGREDSDPSAAINVRTGRYKDSGGEGLSLSLWDFAVQFGPHPDWQAARKHYADKAGVKIGKGRAPSSPAENLTFQNWNYVLASLWCNHKTGIRLDAIQTNGGRLAVYRGQYHVVALPVFGSAGLEVDPVGWLLYDRSGNDLPVFHKDSKPTWKKCKLTAGSTAGLMGFRAIERIASDGPAGKTIWKVEGPSDMLALDGIIPEGLRDNHLVLANANGSTETPSEWMKEWFAGATVHVLHDADQPGQAGAQKWAEWMTKPAAEVRIVKLPYPVEADHGRDLRDWISEDHAYEELLALANAAEPLARAAGGAGGEGSGGEGSGGSNNDADAPSRIEITESDDDPHRLANVFCKHHGTLRYWSAEWWDWTGTHYRRLSREIVRARLNRAVKQEFDLCCLQAMDEAQDDEEKPTPKKVTKTLIGNVLEAVVANTILEDVDELPVWLDGSRSTKGHIALTNGILDLEALLRGEDDCLHPHTPQWFSTNCLPYDFDPDADCPEWKQVTHQNLEGDAARITILQQWAGYLLLPDTNEQKFLFLEGEGANGKTVYLAGVEAMLGGTENVSHVAIDRFGGQFDLAQTVGRLANICVDCNEVDKTAEGTLKAFTGGERMTFDRKNMSPIECKPTARLMLAANNRPRFSDRSRGLWRRMLLIPFLREIEDHERRKGLDKPEYWERSGECPGILNWAIAGLYQLRRQGDFMKSDICETALEEYRQESNPARRFLVEECSVGSEFSIEVDSLYAAYKRWCSKKGHHPLADSSFGKEVSRHSKKINKRRIGPRGAREYRYHGIDLANPETF